MLTVSERSGLILHSLHTLRQTSPHTCNNPSFTKLSSEEQRWILRKLRRDNPALLYHLSDPHKEVGENEAVALTE